MRSAFEPEVLLLSFHGMPERTLHQGDPYHCHCQKTARLLEAELKAQGQRPAHAVPDDLPVALRPRQMAGACDR